MARILFSEFSNVTWLGDVILDCHAQGFVNTLASLGNDVMVVIANKLSLGFLYNELKWGRLEKEQIKRKVKSFDPELIIAYNNNIPDGIIQNTTCPIIIYPADIVTSWAGLSLIRHNLDRYYFLETTKAITHQIKEKIPSISNERIIPFGHATAVRKKDIEQDIRISFVGSILNYSWNTVDYFSRLGGFKDSEYQNIRHKEYCSLFEDFRNNQTSEFDYSAFDTEELKAIQAYEASCINFCNKRFKILSEMSDLGLTIFGWSASWANVMMYDFDIWKCFDYRTSVSLEETIETYNRSIISLNLPQGSNTDGFSWRVTDIMASNAVLLSNKKKDLVNLISPYYKDMPYYESAMEARELAIDLLKNKNWRKEIVEASNQVIEENCRFEQKINIISQALSRVDFYTTEEGGIEVVSEDDVCKPMPQVCRTISRFPRLEKFLKKRYQKYYKLPIIKKYDNQSI